MNVYALLSRLFPTRPAPSQAARIVLILPCCIGDVVLATAALKALRRVYPNAHITWAVGGWSRRAVEHHDLLDAVLDTGPAALPVKSWGGMRRSVRDLRAGQFDLAVSLVRSPLMSVALLLSGIPHRAGIDSAGRGFGCTLRVPVDPATPKHEAEIYLDVIRALGADTTDCWANLPVHPHDAETVRIRLAEQGINGPYIVLNPGGGQNPGMAMDAKRWPPENFAALGRRLAAHTGAALVVIGGPEDGALLRAVVDCGLGDAHTTIFAGTFTLAEIGALAAGSVAYIGNDSGPTHIAAAAGARTVMILGPTDPARYAPYTPHGLALWKPVHLPQGGVASGSPLDWNWTRDGIGADEAYEKILKFLA